TVPQRGIPCSGTGEAPWGCFFLAAYLSPGYPKPFPRRRGRGQAGRASRETPMSTLRFLALLCTGFWLLGSLAAVGVSMTRSYALIVTDHGDGTVTFRDGLQLATTTRSEFFQEAIRQGGLVALIFPTPPCVLALGVLAVLGLARRSRGNAPVDGVV